MLVLFQQLHPQYGRYFVRINVKDGGGVRLALRRVPAGQLHLYPPAAGVLSGGEAARRAKNALLIGALKLLSGSPQNVPSCQTEEQARAWLSAERERPGIPA